MHGTIRTYGATPGFVEKLTDNQDAIKELFDEIPGFRSYYCVRIGDAECVTVTIFDDAAGSQAATEAARTWVAANAADLNVAPPQVSAGEVAFSL